MDDTEKNLLQKQKKKQKLNSDFYKKLVQADHQVGTEQICCTGLRKATVHGSLSPNIAPYTKISATTVNVTLLQVKFDENFIILGFLLKEFQHNRHDLFGLPYHPQSNEFIGGHKTCHLLSFPVFYKPNLNASITE